MNDMAIGGAAARFVGQRVARKEDRRLLTGRGTYVEDIQLPGTLEVAFVRSQIARGTIRAIEVDAARAYPGVHAVLTAQDLDRFAVDILMVNNAPDAVAPAQQPLARDRIRYVGEPIAMVIAENRYIAEDAAGLVEIDYDMEQPVVTIADARDGAPVHPDIDSNLASFAATLDDPEIDAIFARAAHVVEGRLTHQRQAHVPMETRGIVVSPEGSGEMLVYTSCQSPHMAARYLCEAFRMPTSSIRVIAKDVGGAFGLKVQLWREEVAVFAAAMVVRRSLKWIEDRLENLTASNQAREQDVSCRMAFDADARLLAIDIDFAWNIGAFAHHIDCNKLGMMMVPGPYKLPRYRFKAAAYYSNTVGMAAYRGPWAMESLIRETMMDKAARQIGVAPEDIRRRNLVTAQDQPYAMLTGPVLDRVTPLECMEKVLETVDLPAFRAEQAQARREGRYLGIGLSVYVEPTTMAFGGVLSSEVAHIRIDPTGQVVASLSTHSQGHGTATTMAQVIADALGADIEKVSVIEDDSSRGGFGAGAGGSRQAVAGGGAAARASAILTDKVKAIAAHLFNARPEDVSIDKGVIRFAGNDEVTTTLERIAATAYLEPDRLPSGMDLGLEAHYRYRPPPIVFSNAAHACIVEVDGETGVARVVRWVAGEDCGVMINPAIVEGQIAGGLAQGIGGVLFEEIAYDAMGNPTAATFKDYLIPSAHDVPQIEYCHMITPSTTEGGFKGVGEGGAIIGPPAVANAVADAMAPFGELAMNLPLAPHKLMAMMEAAEL